MTRCEACHGVRSEREGQLMADLDLDAIAGRLPTFVSESGIVTEVRVGLTPAERDALVAEVRRLRDALVGIASGGCAECTSAPGWSGCPEDDACDACTARYALEASNG